MQQDFLFSDNDNQVVLRFEGMLRSQTIGYFDVEEFETLVDYYSTVMEFKKALLVVEEGLKQHPASTTLKLQKSRIFHRLGKYKTALVMLRSIGGYTFDIDALMLEGEIHLRLKHKKLADDCFVRLLTLSTEDRDQHCLDIAYIYLGVGEKPMAIRYLKEGLKGNPTNKDILFELALASEDKGEMENAISYYNQLLDIDSYNEDAWFSLAMSYIAMEKFELAIDALDFALAIDDAFISAFMHKGNALMRLEKYHEAIESFEHYGTFDENHIESLVYQAECYEQLTDHQKAIGLYKKALEADDEFLEAYIGLAFCYQTIKDYSESIACFLRALDFNKEDDESWAGLGESYMAIEAYESAHNAFSKSLQITPDQNDLWVFVAGICINQDKITEALEAIKNGLMREPTSPELLILFAYCLILTGQENKARIMLDFDIKEEVLLSLVSKFPKLDLFQTLLLKGPK